jgi:formate dehydrogenase accessory protein FdhE
MPSDRATRISSAESTRGDRELPPLAPPVHNRRVTQSRWQQRIQRAESLAARHAFAAEMLAFYAKIARFQENLYQRLEQAAKNKVSASGPPELPELLSSFAPYLSLVAEQGPAHVATVAHDLKNSGKNSWQEWLNDCWSAVEQPPAEPREFLTLAFLQPYAEFVRSRVPLQLDGYTHSLCPFCSRKPGLGVLRQQGDGGRRSLLCAFCLAEWDFRRILCPGCGEEDYKRLPVYTAEEFAYIRVECCDSCKTYIKSVDLSKHGLAEPVVDEIASVPLDLWAQEHGYAKLHLNLLGM